MKIVYFIFFASYFVNTQSIPAVITTWRFTNATLKAWKSLRSGEIALDAVEHGLTVCEREQCDGTVGYGGSPDENGETTLDALIIDGKTMNVGAVGALHRIKNAISVARHVLEKTKHSFLVGESATQFAIQMGFIEEGLSTPTSKSMWKKWQNQDDCQPNFWMNVKPNPDKFCGPYKPLKETGRSYAIRSMDVNEKNHDTIGMIAIDKNGNIAAGTSTNGAKFKIPGRIGDSPIPGSGAYADNEVGGAVATGDGDIMLRFLPSFLAVEEMRRGSTPQEAARTAIKRIKRHYPDFMGAVVAMNKKGDLGAACNGIPIFPYVAQNDWKNENTTVVFVHCF